MPKSQGNCVRSRRQFGVMRFFAGGILMLTASCAAKAQDEVWRCAVPNGSYDVMEIPIDPAITEVTGEMIFHKAEFGERWLPRGAVGFMDSKLAGGDCQCNGIKAMVFPDQPQFITIYITADGYDTAVGHVPYDKPVTFKLSFKEPQLMTMEVGTGVNTVISRHPTRDRIRLSCTSADVSFRKIVTH